MMNVGIRELKAHLSRFLTQVRQGERITVTDRGRPIAIIGPTAANADDQRIDSMVRDGTLQWEGGKPRGARRPARLKGPTVAAAVLEDRR
jgi:prevent-host-death family protein